MKLHRVDSGIQITVSDSGDGIDPEFLPHIFDRFSQGDCSITRRQGGLGLGLAIVKHLVELHGGIVRADSAGKGRGAAFTIQLPTIFTQEVSEKRDVPSDGLSRKLKTAGGNQTLQNIAGVRLLIVDDNQDTTNLLAATLVDKKALVQTANSVSEALEALKFARVASMSSFRSMRIPPAARARSWATQKVRACPIWRFPVGEGANRPR